MNFELGVALLLGMSGVIYALGEILLYINVFEDAPMTDVIGLR